MPDASWGYTAEQGLHAVLGDADLLTKINKREDAMSPETMREYVNNAPKEKNVSYSDEARRFAKKVLNLADKDPVGFINHSTGLADQVASNGDYELTGFMYGWAVNTVRYVLGDRPIANPAIIEIRS